MERSGDLDTFRMRNLSEIDGTWDKRRLVPRNICLIARVAQITEQSRFISLRTDEKHGREGEVRNLRQIPRRDIERGREQA